MVVENTDVLKIEAMQKPDGKWMYYVITPNGARILLKDNINKLYSYVQHYRTPVNYGSGIAPFFKLVGNKPKNIHKEQLEVYDVNIIQ